MEARQRPARSPMLGALEIVLEVGDLARATHFYGEVLGMPEVDRFSAERPAVWVKPAPNTYLGLWTAQAGGPGVGVHGSRGGAHVHLAFRVGPGALEDIEGRLRAAGIEPAGRVAFGPDQVSLFVHDPDGNVIEFAEWVRSWEGLAFE